MRAVRFLLGATIVLLILAGTAWASTRAKANEYAEALETPTPLYLGPGTETDVVGDLAAGYEYRVVAQTVNWIKIDHPLLGRVWVERNAVSLRSDPAATTTIEGQRKPLRSEPVNVAATEGKAFRGSAPIMISVLLIGLFILVRWVARREEPGEIVHHHG